MDDGFKVKLAAIAIFAVVLAIGIESGAEFFTFQRIKANAMVEERELLPTGEDDHGELRTAFNLPGVTAPEFTTVSSAGLGPKTPVVGIEIDGEAVAFPLSQLEDPHIVNAMIGGKALSVTFCTLVNCVRVLTDESQSQPLDLRLGGQDSNMQMVFMYNGSRYAQESKEIPLVDFPYKRCSLAEWQAKYPKTKIFVAPNET